MLVRTPNLNIYGAIVSSIFSTGVIFLLGFIDVSRYVGFDNVFIPVVKSIGCSLFMGVACLMSYNLLSPLMSVKYTIIISIFISLVCYAFAVLVTKTFTPNDMKSVKN